MMFNVRFSIKKAWASFLVIALLLPLLVGLWPSNVYAASNNEGKISITADDEFTLFINGRQTEKAPTGPKPIRSLCRFNLASM